MRQDELIEMPSDVELAERSSAYARIATALGMLGREHDKALSLEALAGQLELSPFHLQRLFSRWVGVSPKRFLQHLTKERAKAALLAGGDVLSASLAAGMSGPGRLHGLLVTCEAVSPGEMKSHGRGLLIHVGVAPTPFGQALMATSARGLMKLVFVDAADVALEIEALRQDWSAAQIVRDDGQILALAQRLFADYRQPEPVHLFVRGTQFQLKVWEALLQMREGQLATYGEVARQIGQPSAARAVGGAVGSNPIAWLIPCHRVIRGDGSWGGYRWGGVRKQLLLGVELSIVAGE